MEKTKLLITELKQGIVSAYYEKDRMVQINIEPAQAESVLGNIYLGQVKNIVKNINAAFVEYEKGKMCYLSLKDTEGAVFANPKRNTKICEGDTVIIQISKEDVKTKAPVATVFICFTGKYLVLTHGKTNLSVSGKISAEEERERLKSILRPYQKETYGIIIRTNAQGAEEKSLLQELRILDSLYQNIMEFGVHKGRHALLYKAPANFLCSIRDGQAAALSEIVTDKKELYQQIREYLNCYQAEDLEKLRLYEDETTDLNRLYGIETSLSKVVAKQVWLKSGGTLVIEPTEALTVIDVNTGKAIKGNKKVQETFFKVNLEAAKEIAFQLRLRNLSGIIIVDFIDLDSEEHKKELLRALKEYLKEDPLKAVVVDMTPLGLVESTRKKLRKPLHEQLHHL
ncbi:MAG: ribonuclease E/G [Acetivibrio ethanolgignens]